MSENGTLDARARLSLLFCRNFSDGSCFLGPEAFYVQPVNLLSPLDFMQCLFSELARSGIDVVGGLAYALLEFGLHYLFAVLVSRIDIDLLPVDLISVVKASLVHLSLTGCPFLESVSKSSATLA